MEANLVYQLNPNPAQKLPDIEGLAEIKAALSAWTGYMYARKEYEEGFALDMPKKPQVKVGDLEQKYPRASAYLRAEAWKKSPDFARSRLGEQACRKIAAGEDYTQALDEMERGWDAFRAAQEG